MRTVGDIINGYETTLYAVFELKTTLADPDRVMKKLLNGLIADLKENGHLDKEEKSCEK